MADYFADYGDRREYLSFPHALGKTTSVLFLGTPALVSDSHLGGVFSTGAGLMLLAGTALLLVLASRLLLSGSEQTDPLASWLQAARLLCNQGLAAAPSRPCQYVTGAALCLAAMLVCQFYTAGLLSRITTERRRLPFDSLEQALLRPDWQSAFRPGYSVHSFLMSRFSRRTDMARAIETGSRQPYAQEPVRTWVERAERGRFAFFYSASDWPRYCSRQRCPSLCWHPMQICSFDFSVPFRRGQPGEEAWRLALLRARETGLWSALRRRQEPVVAGSPLAACDLEPRSRQHVSGLPLHACQQAFSVLLAGAAAADVLLLGELLLHRLTRPLHRQQTPPADENTSPSQ